MSPVTNVKIVWCAAALILVCLAPCAHSDCTCQPVQKQFNETIKDVVNKSCRKCYVFTYDFSLEEVQDWAASVCVSSPRVSAHTPLLVAVREYLSLTSFQVPLIFEDKNKSSFTEVCRTLCPLANYFDERLSTSKQHMYVEITTQSTDLVEFEMKLSTVNDFVLVNNQPLTVNVTPSQPRVMQYKIEEDLQTVRIEATSSDKSCMILAIDNIQCPFYDSESTVEYSGYFQTVMTQSGITVTKETFPMGRMYVILVLKTSNDACIESYDKTTPAQQFSKEVTIRIVPTIAYGDFILALCLPWIPYLITLLISCITLCCLKKSKEPIDTSTIEERFALSAVNTETPPEHNSPNNEDGDRTAVELKEVKPKVVKPKVVKPPKTHIFVSDLAKKNENIVSKRSKLYPCNLVAVAIFFASPAIQLVFINQGIVNLTGNQDLCYYNFLCSHQVWIFSDFNHIYSNLGYIFLGFLFLYIVRSRESSCKETAMDRRRNGQATGIPCHFGLFYAMGWASIMEGILSGTYHICPCQSNFQFDTAFMYVVATMVLVKIYQARHPDITVKSHVVWIILSVVIFINAADTIDNIIYYYVWHVSFGIAYLIAVFLVSVKIYYMGCVKFNKGILKYVYQNREDDVTHHTCYLSPYYKIPIVFFYLIMLSNIGLFIWHLAIQEGFATFFLKVFLANVIAYLFYYIFFMKIRYYVKNLKKCVETKLTFCDYIFVLRQICIPALFFILAVVTWIVAVSFFKAHKAEWQETPAMSRELNSHCYSMNFYDDHDVWHFVSSFGIFFSYMVLLTLDEDYVNQDRNKIEVF